MKKFNSFDKLSFTTFFCVVVLSYATFATSIDTPTDNIESEEATIETNELETDVISTSSNLSYTEYNYITESEIIKNSINELSTEINNIKNFINDSKKIYNDIEKTYNKTKSLPISEENYKIVKELKKSIVIRSIREGTLSYEDSISQYLKNEEYAKAINKLKNILKNKEEQAEEYRKAYNTWQEILSLIATP